MTQWIIPCNLKYYDVKGAFQKLNCLDWKQSNKSIQAGDEVFIYIGNPIKAIKYRCKVNKANFDVREIDDSEFILTGDAYETYGNYMELELLEEFDDEKYSLDVLRANGLKGNIQCPRRANDCIK